MHASPSPTPPEVIWLIFSYMGEYYSVMMVLNFFLHSYVLWCRVSSAVL